MPDRRDFLIGLIAMILSTKGGPRTTNVSTIFKRDDNGWGSIWFHIARSNPQNAAFETEEDSLIVFHGPHGYISPNWYTTNNAVPTWNFAVVHAKGKPKRIDNDEAFATNLKDLVVENEGHYGGGDVWDFNKLPDSYLKGMRQGIVAYEMKIEAVEGKFKLGHDRSEADRNGVLKGFEKKQQRTILDLTRDYYSRRKA